MAVLSTLNKKLGRELARLKGQVLTIALVVAAGVASMVTLRSTFDSLVFSRDAFYSEARFGDVFAHLEAAPLAIAERLERVPGVTRVQPRIVKGALVPIESMARPAAAQVISLPNLGHPALGDLYVKKGRLPEVGSGDEAVVLDAFAQAHDLEPGDRLPVVQNGRLKRLRIVGTVLSPEHVMALPPGGMSYDPKQFVVLWMRRDLVEASFDLEGAFNDVAAQLAPHASREEVVAQFDRILRPYGGIGAITRDKQSSNFLLNGELTQLQGMGTVVPVFFLFVAAFLLHVVLSRLILLQRGELAALKAIGYRDREIGLHYVKLVTVIVSLGAVLGVGAGGWLGRVWTNLYTSQYFRFPHGDYRMGLEIATTAVLVSWGAALFGALGAVRSVLKLPPAEALRPPSPTRYRRTLIDWLGLSSWLTPATRMVFREALRWPWRLVLSSVGIALGTGMVVVGGYWLDATNYLLEVQFHRAMREDLTLSFLEPRPAKAIDELHSFPGVLYGEGVRTVPVRFSSGPRFRDGAISGYPQGFELRRLIDSKGVRHELPADGLVLTSKLAEILSVAPGDDVQVEVREGDRRRVAVPLAGVIDEAFGLQGHMNGKALARLLGEQGNVNMALLRIDSLQLDGLLQRLRDVPWIASVSSPNDFKEQFEKQSASIIRVFTLILVLFAALIAIGVVYNNARIALSARSRDLASLRVLGFRRSEISAILLGELSLQVFLGLPLGLWFGNLMVIAMMSSVDPETYRLPLIVSERTYALAAVVTLGSAVLSAFIVRRKLDRLDLIGVLKTRE